jgi:predicted  nucleic acid-binding Zn-ribbon protein
MKFEKVSAFCVECGAQFEKTREDHLSCSTKCNQRRQNKKIRVKLDLNTRGRPIIVTKPPLNGKTYSQALAEKYGLSI